MKNHTFHTISLEGNELFWKYKYAHMQSLTFATLCENVPFLDLNTSKKENSKDTYKKNTDTKKT